MMEQMTSRERILAAFRGEATDRTPLANPVSLANADCMREAKAFFPQANQDPIKMAALAETSHTVLHFDTVMPYFGTANELSALGCRVDWGGNDRLPRVQGGILRSLHEFRVPQNYLDKKPLKNIVTAVGLLKKHLKKQVAIVGKVRGPMSLIFYLYGTQNTLNSLILEPETVRQTLDAVKDLVIEFALAQIEAGADVITISEDGVGDLISRECYAQVAMGAEKKIAETVGRQAFTIFHVPCNIVDRADLFSETGFHALHFDYRNDLPQLKALVGDMKLVGGVNVAKTLLNGTREHIFGEVQRSLRDGVSVIAPDGAITLQVSNENLLQMYRSVTEHMWVHGCM